MENIQVKVIASTPGADTNTYNMFNSTVTFGTGTAGDVRNVGLAAHNVSRIEFSVNNSQAGTLRYYMSVDKGLNWNQVGGDIAVPAAAATDISGPYDYLADAYPDVKLDWINGNVAQATWRPTVTLIRGYHGPAT